MWRSFGLDVGTDSEPPCHCELEHQTRRGLPGLEGFTGWTTKEEARPVIKLSFQPSRGGGAQLGSAPELQKRKHPKDVVEAVVPWIRSQIKELGGQHVTPGI